MTVVKLSEYANAPKTRIPLTITFFGPKFHKPDGNDFSVTVRVTVEDGNVFGILNQVQEEGGIGKLEGGRYTFLPWPCACVVMHAPDEGPFENVGDPGFLSEDSLPASD
jgi:hypothetical protein